MPSLICYACSRPAVEVSGVVQDCECGCRKMVAAPYRAPMNLTERCARAEAHAERLAGMLRMVGTSPHLCLSDARKVLEALDAWAAHSADLDTLEGKA